VVGADGHRSTVAKLADVPADVGINERFLYWAYYRGAVLRGPGFNQVWRMPPHVAVATPTDDDLVLIGAFPVKSRLPEFQDDRAGALERFVAGLPDGPDLSGAERVSKVIGTPDYPPVKRNPVPRPGLALIGDAAMAGDPVPAVGCGWAFRSAEWLADATVPALREGGPRHVDIGLRGYRRAHRFAERHDRMDRDDAKALPPNPVQLAIRTAAVHDQEIARRVYLFAVRAVPVSGLLNPKVIARSLRVARRPASRPIVKTWRRDRSLTSPGTR
jgi:flavin-dependent dehydrogenase